MKMDAQDRRVKRTQRLLAQALIALTLEKGYEAVTIRDITERADIGYATFFRHYPDKDALLHEVLEVVLDQLLSLLQSAHADADSVTVGTLLFAFVQQHSEVCRVLLSSRGSTELMRRVIEAGTLNVLQQNKPLSGSLVPPQVAAHHLVTATVSLIQWWLEHGMLYPSEQMGVIYHELIARPTRVLAFGP